MVDMIGDETGRVPTLPAYFLLGRDGWDIYSYSSLFQMKNFLSSADIWLSEH
jgi:hypothetical protein